MSEITQLYLMAMNSNDTRAMHLDLHALYCYSVVGYGIVSHKML